MKLFDRISHAYRKLKNRSYRKADRLAVAVISGGGVGDGLVNLNYIKKLHDYAGEGVEFDYYS